MTPELAEAAEADWLSAKASVADGDASVAAAEASRLQAAQVVAETEVALGHARIASPIAGTHGNAEYIAHFRCGTDGTGGGTNPTEWLSTVNRLTGSP